VGNQITRQMMLLPSGESLGGELDPNPLGLGFVKSGVSEGGSALWNGVAGRSVIERSDMPLVKGSTTDDPLLSSSIVGVLTRPPTVNGGDALRWSGQPPKVDLHPWDVGCTEWWQWRSGQ
jgi:hypothetical protein